MRDRGTNELPELACANHFGCASYIHIISLIMRKTMSDPLTILTSAGIAMAIALVTAIFALTRYRLEKL
jgi:hypothetical protein